METALLVVSLLTQVATLALLVWVWRKEPARRAVADRAAESRLHDLVRRAERRLGERLDLAASQLVELAAEPLREVRVVESDGPDPDPDVPVNAAGAEPSPLRPQPVPPGLLFRSPPRRHALRQLLNASEFRDTVWFHLDGPFGEASHRVAIYLREQDMPLPDVQPYPPLSPEEWNHWRFMVVASAEPGSDGHRVLIPRHFDRFDPALHRHLFDLLGDPGTADRNLRELRRCALLRAQGDLRGGIDRSLVVEKGVVVV